MEFPMRRIIVAAMLALIPAAAGAQTYTTTLTGSLPASLLAGSALGSLCANTGVTSLAVGAATILQCDASGNLKTTATISGSVTVNSAATAGASPPSYSAGINPLSQTLTGGQRVQLNFGADLALGQTTMSGSIPVVLPSNQSAIPVTGTFWQATQPISAASLPLPSNAAQETGGNLATLAGAITSAIMQENNKQWAGVALGAPSAYGTSPGAVTVPGANVFVTNTPTTTASQGTAAALSGAWPVELTDGTNGPAAVKAASTAAVAADKALVVAVSPNLTGRTKASTTALAASKVILASAGSLYSFEVFADSTLYASEWWIMIFDAASDPGGGAVTPAKCYDMPAQTRGFSAAFPNPVAFATGIVISVSTTGCFTETNSTHAQFISGDY
jgi:hypothetical protein